MIKLEFYIKLEFTKIEFHNVILDFFEIEFLVSTSV